MTKLIVAFCSFAKGPTKYGNMSYSDNNVLILVGWRKQKFLIAFTIREKMWCCEFYGEPQYTVLVTVQFATQVM
jgi:hypothetical protein